MQVVDGHNAQDEQSYIRYRIHIHIYIYNLLTMKLRILFLFFGFLVCMLLSKVYCVI